MNKPTVFTALVCGMLALAGTAIAQENEAEEIMFSGATWTLEKAGAGGKKTYLGREAVFLERAQLTLAGRQFSEGVIEFDLASDVASGFVGVNFRDDGAGNSEQFYVRFHQSGRPDSTQYLARLNGLASWQLHAGPNDATAVELGTGQWIPVRIVVEDDQADIFVRDFETPVLHIPELRSDNQSGAVTFYAFDRPEMTTGAYFSNLTVRPLEQGEKVKGQPREEAKVPASVFSRWNLSEPVKETMLTDRFDLEGINLDELSWRVVKTERNGILNIARYEKKTPELDTVFVRLVINADTDGSRLFRFGYSDRVRVYVNGQQQFYGNAQWRSRDHRFLGTVGLHDAVPLHLKAGRNEVVAAVSESFGGWGFVGQIEDSSGLQLSP